MKIQGAFAHLRIRDNGGTGGAFGYLGTLRNTAIPAPTVFAPMNNQGAFPHLRTRDNGGTGGAFGYLAEQDNVAEESALNELPADNYGIHSTPAVSVTSGHIADGMIDARHIAANSTTNVGFTEDSAPKVGLFHKLFKTPMEKVVGGLILITILLMMLVAGGGAGWLWWLAAQQ